MRRARRLALLLALLGATSAAPARGQPAPPSDVEATTEEAQRRFQLGVERYKEGDLEAALVEFKRAYELVPSYKILYNLGQVSYQRRDYANALRYFRRYLGEGDAAIAVPRQHEVASDIARLEERVGQLEIEAGEAGAEVLVDDAFAGRMPLGGPVLVNAGRRKVELVGPGGTRQTRVVEIAGRETVRIVFPRPTRPAPKLTLPRPSETPSPTQLTVASKPVVVATSLVSRAFPWKSWTVTALLAAGAAATGTFAWLSKRELDHQLAAFPPDPAAIDLQNERTRGFALATDGLLIGTALMTALSLYLTFREPG